MKTNISIIIFFLLGITSGYAHYIWIETHSVGELNRKHEVKIRFGEYTYGVIEKVNGEAFQGVSDFSVWLFSPDGKKMVLETEPGDDCYLASFVPEVNGTYTIALDNRNMEVLDYTQYNFGIFKPQYHAKARVVVGQTASPAEKTNAEGIEIVDISNKMFDLNGEVVLRVLFKRKPLAENEVVISISDLWTKTLHTGEDGTVRLLFPGKPFTPLKPHTTKKHRVPSGKNRMSLSGIVQHMRFTAGKAKTFFTM